MDFRNLKTVLILVLLLVLTAGVVLYAGIKRNDMEISLDYENRILALLDNANISIERDIIPRSGLAVKNLYTELANCKGSDFVTAVLGADYSKTAEDTFSANGSRLTITTDGAVYRTAPQTLNSGREQEICTAFLRSVGVDVNLYKPSFGQYSEDGVYTARYTACFENIEIFNSYIDVEFSAENTSVTFKNPIEACKAADGGSAVFGGASVLAGLPGNLGEDGGVRRSVTDIRLGAAVVTDGLTTESAFTIPVWQVVIDGERALIYDARSGEFIQ